MALAIVGVCIPTFVTAPLLVLLFASTLGWLPSAGWNDGAILNLVLPVAVLALPQIAIISRLTRAGMIEVLRSNYVRTARAKGLPEHRIVIRHALRAALLPLVSYLGPACAGLITGSLVVERIFNLPGLGKFFVISALQRDYTVVMGMVIFYAGLILVLNLVADLIYAALDPRVKLV
jgi:oligopeptide transport system permease protein